MSDKQTNIGSNNTNIDLSHVNIFIDDTQKFHEISLKIFFEEYKKKFRELDKIINSRFPTQMIVNKTGAYETYSTQKIILSLAKIGIPLEITYYIAETVAKEIIKKVEEKSIVELSTKQIRKIVSKAIQNYDGKDYSLQDIEEWNEKYIRRYGHNNQLVKIYDENSCVDVSYNYIYKNLLPDIVQSITQSSVYDRLSSAQKTELAEEILDFINNCSLYKINYNVLKSIIMEIATQPPHPWFVNSDTRKSIMDYDEEQLQHNLKKLHRYIEQDNSDTSFQYIIFEVLHHGASLLLAKYNHFLGVKDTSAFFILQNLLKQLEKEDCCDLMLTSYSFSKIFSDITYANVDVNAFLQIINEIADNLKPRKIERELAYKVEKFGENILQIINSTNQEETLLSLSKAWQYLNQDKLLLGIKQTLYSIAPYRRFNTSISKNFFWMNYKSNWLDRGSTIMVYVAIGEDNAQEVIDKLISYEIQSLCSTVFLVAESKEDAIKIKEKMQSKLQQQGVRSYLILTFDKSELISLINSKQKVTFVKELIDNQVFVV